MEEQLGKLVEKALQLAEQTGEFAIEQAPLLLQEFYMWHIALSIMSIVLLPLNIISIMIVKKVLPEVEEDIWSYNFLGKIVSESSAGFGYIFGGVSLIFSVTFFFIGLRNLVFILVAPKLYLIEYFLK
jgi:hypothetical protein